MSTDDAMRAALRRAHADDSPPSFPAFASAANRPRRRWWLLVAPTAIATVVAIVVVGNRAPPPPTELPRVTMDDPLAFLMQSPSSALFTSVPRFDAKGVLP